MPPIVNVPIPTAAAVLVALLSLSQPAAAAEQAKPAAPLAPVIVWQYNDPGDVRGVLT